MTAFAAIANDVPTQSVTVWKGKDWVGVAFERVNTTVVFCLPFFPLDRQIVGSVSLLDGLSTVNTSPDLLLIIQLLCYMLAWHVEQTTTDG